MITILIFWQLVALTSSWKVKESTHSRRIYGNQARYSKLKASTTDTITENDFESRIENSIISFIQTLCAKEHPGYAYGLGANSWNAGGYSGTIQSWSGRPSIRWISRSFIKNREMESSPVKDVVDKQTDFHIILHSENEIPHLKIRITRTIRNQLHLYLDYLPRKELVCNIHSYYDKYYQGMDREYFQKLDKAVHQHRLVRSPTSDSVLFRMLVSPFALCLSTSSNSSSISNDQCTYLVELLNAHLGFWRSWYDKHSTAEPTKLDAKTSEIIEQRDQSLLDIWREELKYEYAAILGGEFAPKAEVVADAMMGPDFVSVLASSSDIQKN